MNLDLQYPPTVLEVPLGLSFQYDPKEYDVLLSSYLLTINDYFNCVKVNVGIPTFHEYAYPDFYLSETAVCCTLWAEEIVIAILGNRVATCAHIYTLDAYRTMTVKLSTVEPLHNGHFRDRRKWPTCGEAGV